MGAFCVLNSLQGPNGFGTDVNIFAYCTHAHMYQMSVWEIASASVATLEAIYLLSIQFKILSHIK